MDLSANLRAIVSQRLVRREDGNGRKAAIEILINTPTISDKLMKGAFHELKAVMANSRELGMRTFDWALFDLYNDGHISYEEALRNADSMNELRLHIKLKSARGEPKTVTTGATLALHTERRVVDTDGAEASAAEPAGKETMAEPPPKDTVRDGAATPRGQASAATAATDAGPRTAPRTLELTPP